MKDNPLKNLQTLGQSIWLDYIRRDLIATGALRRLIEDNGLRGMTSTSSRSVVPTQLWEACRTHSFPSKTPDSCPSPIFDPGAPRTG